MGLEGYGVLPTLGNTPGLDFQEHRIGPVLYFERSLKRVRAAPAKISLKDSKAGGGDKSGEEAEGPKLNIEAGILFGLTDATQDRVYKFKGAITF